MFSLTWRELSAWCGRVVRSVGQALWRVALPAAALLATQGCSAKDPLTATPSYHVGVKTNSSSVNSWELNKEPLYTQPGVNSGRPVILKAIPSQRGFEPNDPLAEDVYAALQAEPSLPTRYLTASAKDGVVILTGTLPSPALRAKAEATARRVPGVRALRSRLVVTPPPASAP